LIEADDLIKNYAQYLLECCLLNYETLKYRPSHIAATCLFLAKKILKQKPSWSPFLEAQTSFKEKEDLRPLAKVICHMLNDI
jgi:hypothetical protein